METVWILLAIGGMISLILAGIGSAIFLASEHINHTTISDNEKLRNQIDTLTKSKDQEIRNLKFIIEKRDEVINNRNKQIDDLRSAHNMLHEHTHTDEPTMLRHQVVNNG